jgi:hypothetical protein
MVARHLCEPGLELQLIAAVSRGEAADAAGQGPRNGAAGAWRPGGVPSRVCRS